MTCEIGSKKQIANNYYVQIVKLHQAGVWHKDFSPGNILYTGNAVDGYHFSYIDLNRMSFGISDRKKLMSMFRSINLNRAETERLGRYYALASGQDVDVVVDQVRKSKTFSHSGKVQGRFFTVLMTNQINECQQ